MTKSTNKYVSVNKEHGSLKYREIAEIMTDSGDKMNHATVRNIILRGYFCSIQRIIQSLRSAK